MGLDYSEEVLMGERHSALACIREYVSYEWDGAGLYEVEDYDGTRKVEADTEDDLVWEIYGGWHNATIRKVDDNG